MSDIEITGNVVPAHVGIQIRDGVWNRLVAFDIVTVDTQVANETALPGAELVHDVDLIEIIHGLAEALKRQVDAVRAETTGEGRVNFERDMAKIAEDILADR